MPPACLLFKGAMLNAWCLGETVNPTASLALLPPSPLAHCQKGVEGGGGGGGAARIVYGSQPLTLHTTPFKAGNLMQICKITDIATSVQMTQGRHSHGGWIP